MRTVNMNKRYILLIFTLLIFSHIYVFSQNQAINIVRNYANNLKAYVETGDINYRISLDKITPPNCLVNDVVAQCIVQENNYPAGTLRVADYYNAFEKWRLKGNLSLRLDYLECQKNIVAPGEMSTLGDTLYVVMGRLNINGAVNFTDRVMYFVRRNKITKIISTGDGETLGKGIELYSNKNYNEAFKLFRKLANADKSAYMAQYWTAVMLLNGEGCEHIDKYIRRQEAIWWLARGREMNRLFLEKSWNNYRKGHNISYTDYVIQFGEELTYNQFPEALRLMIEAYNEAGIISDEFRFYKWSDYSQLLRNYRPITGGLMVKIEDGTGLHGYVNEQNKVVIPCKYKIAFPFGNNGLALVYDKNGKKGFINTKGEEVIPCIYDSAEDTFLGNTFFALKDEHLLVVTDKNQVLRSISGYNKLLTISLDKYVVIYNPKTKKGDMYDSMGNVVLYDIDDVIVDITEIRKVIKNNKIVYVCYDNWR